MSENKISFFFGAGAEIDYGLPTGGKFALDIFRISNEEDKQRFRNQIQNIDYKSQIATQWLPSNYQKKRLNVFGKGEFEGLIASSLENKRANIQKYLDTFDEKFINILKSYNISEEDLNKKFQEFVGEEIGDKTYSQAIKLNEKLAKSVPLFESEYFSAFLRLLEKKSNDQYLKKIIRGILELLIGTMGQSLVSQLNEELFESAPDEISVFDDLSGVFSLNYQGVGQTGMEIVIEYPPNEFDLDDNTIKIFSELGRKVLEEIYCESMDYQALIDSHFRYLYQPKSHWAKFSRIAIFLHTVRRYIKEIIKVDEEKINEGPGYYHDLIDFHSRSDYQIKAIGTTNYNSLVERILEGSNIADIKVYHLNGGVDEFYDPYRNEIVNSEEQLEDKITVPFIFTQSGVKPLTTITMSKRYVELYQEFLESDLICVIGYAFNGDDGHINGLFRSLVEQDKKKLVILHYSNTNRTIRQIEKEYQNKLRLESTDNLHILQVDRFRKVDSEIWYNNI